MPSTNQISADKLVRLIGAPRCPALLDVRPDEDFGGDPRLAPGSVRRPYDAVSVWAKELPSSRSAVVICKDGLQLSGGVAALLRDYGVPAHSLEGGLSGWAESGLPLD
jgi:rhodanese-related sulfurtransferase